MASFYMISFDADKVDTASLHTVIKSSGQFLTWWHYLSSTYIVKSNNTVFQITDDLITKWPNQRFVIVKIDPYTYSGWLNKDAWQWFKDHRD
jgi:hypothetical protein